ncbi:MAG: endolytic transglycosylase MltG [Deltaproteobacteria bacterium]|nr:endolytic transglycosylase MltG [Deltaproteobacteria bacterium]
MFYLLHEYFAEIVYRLKPVFNFYQRKREAYARHSRSWKILFAIALTMLIIIGGLLFNLTLAPTGNEKGSIVIDILSGSSLQSVISELEEKKLIKNSNIFTSLVYWHGSGRAIIKAGEYEFYPKYSQWRIARMLVKGITMFHKVAIPENWTVAQVARRLSARRLANYDVFMAMARNTTFLNEMGISAKSVEGFLYPETYYFHRMMNERQIMAVMIGQFKKEFTPQMEFRAHKMGFSVLEVVIIASMIAKEATLSEEKPLIAAVFHNRLRLGMRLQSDPTAVYDFETPRRKVRSRDLKSYSKHNTYLISGLPSGPIANPNKQSLLAALYPAQADYLYFVALRNGSHIFSTRYDDHKKAIEQIYGKRVK